MNKTLLRHLKYNKDDVSNVSVNELKPKHAHAGHPISLPASPENASKSSQRLTVIVKQRSGLSLHEICDNVKALVT